MPDAVVDYELSSGTWSIIQQQNLLHERTRVLYGSASSVRNPGIPSISTDELDSDHDNLWNSLSEYYACEQYEVPSHDKVLVSLTVVYSRNRIKQAQNPGLLHGHGAYGELLDKRWRSELKSLLDRGWVIAYADVRLVAVNEVEIMYGVFRLHLFHGKYFLGKRSHDFRACLVSEKYLPEIKQTHENQKFWKIFPRKFFFSKNK